MRYFFVLSFCSILFLGIGAHSAAAQDTIPRITVTASQIDFGNTPLDSVKQRSFLIINTTSDTNLVLSGAVSSVGAPFTIDSGGGAFTLDSGASKRIYVSFHPLALTSFQDSIVITNNSDSASSRIVVYLSGTGFIPDTVLKFDISPQTLEFGTVYTGQSSPKKFTIKNTTNTNLKLQGTVLDAHVPFHTTIGLGNFQLSNGQSKDVTIQFAPSIVGEYTDSVIVMTNADSPANRIVIKLHATVLSADLLKPKIGITVDTINFGQMTPNPTQTLNLFFTIKNISDSGQTLTVNILSPSGNNNFSFAAVDHLMLLPFESQRFTVGFSPKAPGNFLDSIIVISDAAKSRIPVYLKAKVVPTGAVGAAQDNLSSVIEAYPNPARDIVLLRFTTEKVFKPECSIYDVTGKLILKNQLAETSIGANALLLEVSELPAGIYQMKIDGLETPGLVKVVVVR
ncbi:MAG TPA: choice-of-anchor D domain-containing protein [Candidatus Kapabacteria bacterium]|nr:choice-of-anchor D domain-containing protein [Candidatus Kapabacteria bacterium]